MNDLFLNMVGYASGISIILGCLALVFFKLIKPIAVWFQKVSLSADIVKQELRFNGGTSIKDAIQKIGLQLTVIEAKKRALLTHMKVAFFETDILGRLTFASIVCCHLFHRSEDELLGSGWLNFVTESDRDRVSIAWHRAINESRDIVLKFNLQIPESHKILPVCFEGYVIRDKYDNMVSMLALITPYTDCPSNDTSAA